MRVKYPEFPMYIVSTLKSELQEFYNMRTFLRLITASRFTMYTWS